MLDKRYQMVGKCRTKIVDGGCVIDEFNGVKVANEIERVDMVRQAVADLPDRQRAVINLHRYKGMSHKDITESTGWSQSAVESLLVRAYANLRQSLSQLKES